MREDVQRILNSIVELWNTGNVEAARRLYADSAQRHDPITNRSVEWSGLRVMSPRFGPGFLIRRRDQADRRRSGSDRVPLDVHWRPERRVPRHISDWQSHQLK